MTIYDTSNTTLLVNRFNGLYSVYNMALKSVLRAVLDYFRIELMVRYQLRAEMAQKGFK